MTAAKPHGDSSEDGESGGPAAGHDHSGGADPAEADARDGTAPHTGAENSPCAGSGVGAEVGAEVGSAAGTRPDAEVGADRDAGTHADTDAAPDTGSVTGPDTRPRTGPLTGVRVVELAGIGPGPFAGMLLGDLGADVVRVDRPGGAGLGIEPVSDVTNRSKRSVTLDLKDPDGLATALGLVERADVLIEGYRPGVAERLGIGPDDCLARNPSLVYGRMTGWGQDGPLAQRAGHDLGYIALTGALGLTGPADGPPYAPANLLGDYAGGSLYLVIGVLAALQHARTPGGRGQVVDAAIVDGTSHLTAMLHGMIAAGAWQDRRGVNLLDGGAPFYGTYETADGGHMAVGALEPQFYEEFVRLLGLDGAADGTAAASTGEAPAKSPGTSTGKSTGHGSGNGTGAPLPGREDPRAWGELRTLVAERFRTRTRDEWDEVFRDSDACVSPVLSLREAPAHPHLAARGTFVEHAGITQPAPAPRFSATPAAVSRPPALPGADVAEVARDWDLPALACSLSAGPGSSGPRSSDPRPAPDSRPAPDPRPTPDPAEDTPA